MAWVELRLEQLAIDLSRSERVNLDAVPVPPTGGEHGASPDTQVFLGLTPGQTGWVSYYSIDDDSYHDS